MIPENFSSLTNLRELSLLNNRLESLNTKIGLMCGLSKIEFSNNCLTELPDSFAALTKLGNCLSLMFDGCLTHRCLARAERVVIENNRLKTLPENLEAMFSCRVLNVSNNQLVRLPRCIGRMPSLTTLSNDTLIRP